MLKREKEDLERIRYQQALDNKVDAIIREAEEQGKTFSDNDRKILCAFMDERNISDADFNKLYEELKKKENENIL